MAFKLSNIPAAMRALAGRGVPDKAYPGGGIFVPGYESNTGISISAEQAMRLATVHACVRVLSEDVASLPLNVYKRLKDKGKKRADDHPLFDLLRNKPNPEMTAYTFIEAMMTNLLLEGNAYAFIEYDNAARVRALWPLVSYGVEPYRDTETKEIKFRVGATSYKRTEILHIPGLSFDGLRGLTPIGYARESLGLAVAAEMYGAKFFKNGTHLGGVVTLDGELSEPAYERMKKAFNTMYKGLQNAQGVPILEKGSKYTPIGINPEEAQFLETRKFQRTEIAAIYRVPPHMIGDLERATFSNIEHQDTAYLQRTLLPWLTRWKHACTAWLLTENDRRRFFVEHDTGNFLKGDTRSRMQAYAAAIQGGFMTPNEAREKENLNPLPGGDDLRLPLNTVPGSQEGNPAPGETKPKEQDPPPDEGNETKE